MVEDRDERGEEDDDRQRGNGEGSAADIGRGQRPEQEVGAGLGIAEQRADPAGERIVLADEVLTPDSSRYWPADDYEPGRGQASFDKQYLRDWLDEQGWDRTPPPPKLPDDVIANTRSKYLEAYERITGRVLN